MRQRRTQVGREESSICTPKRFPIRTHPSRPMACIYPALRLSDIKALPALMLNMPVLQSVSRKNRNNLVEKQDELHFRASLPLGGISAGLMTTNKHLALSTFVCSLPFYAEFLLSPPWLPLLFCFRECRRHSCAFSQCRVNTVDLIKSCKNKNLQLYLDLPVKPSRAELQHTKNARLS